MIHLASLAVWSAILTLLVACELAARVGPRRVAGFGRLMDAAAAGRWRTLLLFVGWMWLGWHFFAR